MNDYDSVDVMHDLIRVFIGFASLAFILAGTMNFDHWNFLTGLLGLVALQKGWYE